MDPQQFGAPVRPTVGLKRGLDVGTSLWEWHQLARTGVPNAWHSATLDMYTAADYAAKKSPVSTWLLESAWCAKIDIAAANAGSAEIIETVQIVCDLISPKGL